MFAAGKYSIRTYPESKIGHHIEAAGKNVFLVVSVPIYTLCYILPKDFITKFCPYIFNQLMSYILQPFYNFLIVSITYIYDIISRFIIWSWNNIVEIIKFMGRIIKEYVYTTLYNLFNLINTSISLLFDIMRMLYIKITYLSSYIYREIISIIIEFIKWACLQFYDLFKELFTMTVNISIWIFDNFIIFIFNIGKLLFRILIYLPCAMIYNYLLIPLAHIIIQMYVSILDIFYILCMTTYHSLLVPLTQMISQICMTLLNIIYTLYLATRSTLLIQIINLHDLIMILIIELFATLTSSITSITNTVKHVFC